MEKRILVIGLVFLFLFSSIIPISIGYNVKTPNIVVQPSNRGNTLYVGGDGPNNYTKIQDAIDNASNGDTVFVYSGTYYEHVYVNKTINLIGENKEKTIINYIVINANSTIVKGFSITGYGISINSKNHNIIEDNIIFNNQYYGIYVEGNDNNVINNTIVNNAGGIRIGYPQGGGYCINTTISGNTIAFNKYGIFFWMGYFNNIINNSISNNINGIWFQREYTDNRYDIISDNNIENNSRDGIYLQGACLNNKIIRNNLINNGQNAFSILFYSERKIWDGNYWSDYRGNGSTPKIIRGQLYIYSIYLAIPWLFFDWHPALKPYDIGV